MRHPAADVCLPHRDPQAEPHRPGRHAHPAPHAQVACNRANNQPSFLREVSVQVEEALASC